MSDSTTPQDDTAMSPASTGSLANAHSARQDAEAKIIADGIAEIMRIASEPNWIPVTERLPLDAEWVIVSRAGGTLSVEAMHKTGGRFMRGNSPVHPTHWMPLPAPPTDAK